MDGFDLFRRLGSGAKFNLSRFKSDAEQLRIIQHGTAQQSSKRSELVKVDAQSQKNGTTQRKRKLSALQNDGEDDYNLSSENENNSESNDITDEETEDINLLGKIKASNNSKALLKKKSKHKVKSKERKSQIKEEEMRHFRRKKRIHVQGTDVPYPLHTFGELQENYGLSPKLLENISDVGYMSPTPIQMQALPVMMQQREILACAPTGSGKTAAFLIPILHQLKGPKKLGFRALILAPTRELAQQTYRECKRLSEGLNFRIHVIEKASSAVKKFGPKTSQKFDILITTPNRLIHLLKQDPPVINLKNVEWLVVDESDKLFEEGKTGFRDQLGVIYKACCGKNVRRAMFSATFAFEVEQWCKLNLDNVIHVYIGAKNSATRLVEQELLFVGAEEGKLLAMRQMIKKGIQPPVLIFVQSKERAKELYQELIYDGINVDVIHADRTQVQRENVVTAFRSGKIWVLICTDLMGRGIDFKGINLVINYDFPNSAISYIHRIGRTGRAGRKGKAVTFFTEDDKVNLKSIANVIKAAGCPVPDYMLNMFRPKKDIRRKLAKSEVKRKTIRTFPKAEIVAARKRRQNVKKAKVTMSGGKKQSQAWKNKK